MNKSRLFTTRNNLDAESREKIVTLLNQYLADMFDLYSQTKQGHWSVKGPHFFALHELFDKLAAQLADDVDTIAERATSLGGTARGTARQSAATSRLPEYDRTRRRVCSMLRRWPCATPHLLLHAGRRSTQPGKSATLTRRTCSLKSHGDWTRRSGSWKATCRHSLCCRE
jgi:DNA-binding ferritin-like protein